MTANSPVSRSQTPLSNVDRRLAKILDMNETVQKFGLKLDAFIFTDTLLLIVLTRVARTHFCFSIAALRVHVRAYGLARIRTTSACAQAGNRARACGEFKFAVVVRGVRRYPKNDQLVSVTFYFLI